MRTSIIGRIVLILFLLIPLFLNSAAMMWGWVLAAAVLFLIWSFTTFSRERVTTAKPAQLEPRMLHEEEQPGAVREVMNVKIAIEKAGVLIFRGRLREAASSVYARLRAAFPERTIPFVQEDEELGATIMLMPKSVEQISMERPVRPWLNILLFVLTLLTTTWIGALQQGVNLFSYPLMFPVGLQYAIGLLSILGVHEFGHYFMARYYGMRVTPPYFIPVPFALGTFGAFIQLRSPSENRKSLFDVALAGPLAGLFVAIPALIIGLHSSRVIPEDAGPVSHSTSLASSILLAVLAKASIGPAIHTGHLIQLSPLAFAGWLGLFITALNLMPVGQLDGGHIARAMFGTKKGTTLSSITLWTMFLLTVFVWPGLLMWMIILFFISGNVSPPLNDVTPLSFGRFLLGILAFVILLLIVLPVPRHLWSLLQINQPYM